MQCIANLGGSNPSCNHFSVSIFGEYIGKTHCLHPHFVQVSIYYIVYDKFLLTYVISSNFLFLQELLKAHCFHLKFSNWQVRIPCGRETSKFNKCFILGRFKHQTSLTKTESKAVFPAHLSLHNFNFGIRYFSRLIVWSGPRNAPAGETLKFSRYSLGVSSISH